MTFAPDSVIQSLTCRDAVIPVAFGSRGEMEIVPGEDKIAEWTDRNAANFAGFSSWPRHTTNWSNTMNCPYHASLVLLEPSWSWCIIRRLGPALQNSLVDIDSARD
jgi:hypothetical protein